MITRYDGTQKIADVSVGGDSLASDIKDAVDSAVSELTTPKHSQVSGPYGTSMLFQRVGNVVTANIFGTVNEQINANTGLNFVEKIPSGYIPAYSTSWQAILILNGVCAGQVSFNADGTITGFANATIPRLNSINITSVYPTNDPMPN